MSDSQIFDEWTAYEKVVAGDYMHHCEFFAALIDEIGSGPERRFSIVDIGCGDAQPVLSFLKRFEVEQYVGIDRSETALDRARRVLVEAGIPFDLRHGSMLEELRNMRGNFGLAIASYSLHHLDRDEKRAALKECRRLLPPGGLLAVIDVFLEEGESRSGYLKRWQENARQRFTALAPDELRALLEHVQGSDIPETVADYSRIGLSAGFTSIRLIRQDRERLNKLVVLC